MGKKDAVAKEYMRDPEVFADAFNHYLYQGRKVIKPENLQELDVASTTTFYGDDGKAIPIQRIRDVLKKATVMTDGRVAYLLVLGIENQILQHFAMPVRVMAYDVAEYIRQVDAAEKSRGKGGKAKLKGEFLSEFHSTDKLIPVVTLVIYLNPNPWTAPRSLHEMFDFQDAELLQYVPDYKINLIEPFSMTDKDFDKFRTDLSPVLKFLKNAGSKRKLQELTESDATYDSIAWKTATMLNTITDSKLKFGRRKERVNMCQAIREMREESEAIGEARGRAEGRAEGRVEGREEGRAEERAKMFKTLGGFVADGLVSIKEAAKRTGVSVAEFRRLAGL